MKKATLTLISGCEVAAKFPAFVLVPRLLLGYGEHA